MSKKKNIIFEGEVIEKYFIEEGTGVVTNLKGGVIKPKGGHHVLYINGKHRSIRTEKLLNDAFAEVAPIENHYDATNSLFNDFVNDTKEYKGLDVSEVRTIFNHRTNKILWKDNLTESDFNDIVEEVKNNPFYFARKSVILPTPRNRFFTAAHYTYLKAIHEQIHSLRMVVSSEVNVQELVDLAVLNLLITTDKNIYIAQSKASILFDLQMFIEEIHPDLVKFIDFSRIYYVNEWEYKSQETIPFDNAVFILKDISTDKFERNFTLCLENSDVPVYHILLSDNDNYHTVSEEKYDVWGAMGLLNAAGEGRKKSQFDPRKINITTYCYLWDLFIEELIDAKDTRTLTNKIYNEPMIHITRKGTDYFEGTTHSLHKHLGIKTPSTKVQKECENVSEALMKLTYENYIFNKIKDTDDFKECIRRLNEISFSNHPAVTTLNLDMYGADFLSEELQRAQFTMYYMNILKDPVSAFSPYDYALIIFGITKAEIHKTILMHQPLDIGAVAPSYIHDITRKNVYNIKGRIMSAEKTYYQLLKYIYGQVN